MSVGVNIGVDLRRVVGLSSEDVVEDLRRVRGGLASRKSIMVTNVVRVS